MVWDLVARTDRRVDPPANIWCAGQTLLADGRVVVAGGNLAYERPGEHTFKGLDQIRLFDPSTERWTRAGPPCAMVAGTPRRPAWPTAGS